MTLETMAGAAYGLLLLAGGGLGVWGWRRGRAIPPRWPARIRRLVRRPFSGVDALGLAAGVVLMTAVAGAVLAAMGAAEDEVSPRAVMVHSLAVHWTVLLLLALVLRMRGLNWRRAFGARGARLARVIGLGAAAYLVMLPSVVLFAAVYRLLLQSLGLDTGMQDVTQVLTGEASPPVRAYLLFLGMFLGPLAEECLFRGVLLPVLARRFGAMAGMLTVSAIFAGIHLHLPSLLPLFVLSVWLCLGYLYAGSILVPVVMHMLFNAVNLAVVFLVGG